MMMRRGCLVLLCFTPSAFGSDLDGQLASIRAALKAAESGQSQPATPAPMPAPMPEEHQQEHQHVAQHKTQHKSRSTEEAKSRSTEHAEEAKSRSTEHAKSRSKESTKAQQSSSGGASDYSQYMNTGGGGSDYGGSDYGSYMKKYGSSNGNYKQYMSQYGNSNKGNYQKYMNKYSGGNDAMGNYQNYINKYGGSQGGMSYQDYVKKYSGGNHVSYQQYMEKGAGGGQFQGDGDAHSKYYSKYLQNYASGDHGAAAGQQGDYQQFMKKYQSNKANYQQYMELGAGGSQTQGDGQAHSGYYKQYLENYAQGGSKAGNYQNYVQKYTGGNQSSAESGDYQQYVQKYQSGSSSKGQYQQYINKYAGQRGGSQSGDYQQYMQKYAGGASTGSKNQAGDYQNYIQQYGQKQGSQVSGDYQNYVQDYAQGNQANGQSSYADYSQYMGGNSKAAEPLDLDASPADSIELIAAKDAKTMKELDSWKSSAEEKAKKYVPKEYQHYALSDIDKEYKTKEKELESTTTAPAILDLYAVADKRDKRTTDELRQDAEAGVKEAEELGESLKRSSKDTDKILNLAAKPAKEVEKNFTGRANNLEQNIKSLQSQASSQQAGDDFDAQVEKSMKEAKALRDDEMRALHNEHRQASNAARHTARGTQDQIRQDARRVEALSDQLARKNRSYERLDDELGNRVEAAADTVEEYSEDLSRQTEDHLQENMRKAQETVRRNADRRFRALHEAKATMAKTASKSTGFLAQPSGLKRDVTGVSMMALLAASCSFMTFFATRKSRQIVVSESLLG